MLQCLRRGMDTDIGLRDDSSVERTKESSAEGDGDGSRTTVLSAGGELFCHNPNNERRTLLRPQWEPCLSLY